MCSTCVNNETTCTPMLTELLLRAGMSHVVGAVERPVLLSHRAEFPPVHHLSFCPCCWMLMLFFLCCLSCCAVAAAAAYYHTPVTRNDAAGYFLVAANPVVVLRTRHGSFRIGFALYIDQ